MNKLNPTKEELLAEVQKLSEQVSRLKVANIDLKKESDRIFNEKASMIHRNTVNKKIKSKKEFIEESKVRIKNLKIQIRYERNQILNTNIEIKTLQELI